MERSLTSKLKISNKQLQQLPDYFDNWLNLVLSTEKEINQQKATEAINLFYNRSGLNYEPQIVFTESPLHIFIIYMLVLSSFNEGVICQGYKIDVCESFYKKFFGLLPDNVVNSLAKSFGNLSFINNSYSLNSFIEEMDEFELISDRSAIIFILLGKFHDYGLINTVNNPNNYYEKTIRILNAVILDVYKDTFIDFSSYQNTLGAKLINMAKSITDIQKSSLYRFLSHFSHNLMSDIVCHQFYTESFYGINYVYYLCIAEHLKEVIGLNKELFLIDGLLEVTKHCGWILPLNNICFVCPKPQIMEYRTNRQGNIEWHAEARPVLYYCEDFQIWAYNGVILDNKKYHCHPNRWQPEWLLKEENAEIRRILIQVLGSDRILSELKADLIDTFESSKQGKYELYRIPDKIDIVKYMILKMTCPSTGLTHAHRVPPNIRSARAAVSWINHGIDPEKFYDVS